MKLEIVNVDAKAEWRLLKWMDRKIFNRENRLKKGDWLDYDCSLALVDGFAAGYVAVSQHSDLDDDKDALIPVPGTLFIGRVGILPLFRKFGLGTLLLTWAVTGGRTFGFSRITCDCREGNLAIRKLLEKKFGFKIIKRSPPIVILELRLSKDSYSLSRSG